MFADIEFRPVCSKCGRMVDGIVDCSQTEPYRSGGYNVVDYLIEPGKCQHCGALFQSIRMPTRLPFDNRSVLTGGDLNWDD